MTDTKKVAQQRLVLNDQAEELKQQFLDTKKELEKLDLVLARLEKEVDDGYKNVDVLIKPSERKGLLVRRLTKIKTAIVKLNEIRKVQAEQQVIANRIIAANQRIAEISNEIYQIDRFLTNPFTVPEKQRKQIRYIPIILWIMKDTLFLEMFMEWHHY